MRTTCIAASTSLLLCAVVYYLARKLLVGESQLEFRDGKLALVRPATPQDAEVLLSSFELWEENLFPPCDESQDSSQRVDLVLSFSRMTNETLKVANKVREEFKRTNGWDNCFQAFHVLDAHISKEEDKYDEELQDIDFNWVNGPNTQFRSVFGDVRDLGYDAFFLMEADTFPRARGWLNLLENEIEESRPFGILGSKYKGSVWDENKAAMPVALLEHINGNAIYNVTDPFLVKIVDELEKERDTLYNAVSYDYRISQIYMEAAWDIPSTFPFPRLVATSPQSLPQKKELFRNWWKDFGRDSFIEDSRIVANYGVEHNTVEDIGDSVIVHGRQYNPLLGQDPNRLNGEQKHLRRNMLLLNTIFDQELDDAQFHRGAYGRGNQCLSCQEFLAQAGCAQCTAYQVDPSTGASLVSVNFLGCKNEAVSWVGCCNDPNCSVAPQGSCNGDEDKCETVSDMTFTVTAGVTSFSIDMKDGQFGGIAITREETCGGTDSSCSAGPRGGFPSGVCQTTIDMTSCPGYTV